LSLPAVRIAQGDIERAIAWATEAYKACDVCAERCGVDRHAGPAGRCGLDADARIYKEYLHLGEERLFVPGHAVYLSGCSFRCAFCSDDTAVRQPITTGTRLSPAALATRIAERRAQGATNVNFVGGVPDVNVLFLLKTIRLIAADTHIVWNTNFWTTPTAIDNLRPIIGTWLIDYKFGSDACALKLAGSRDYLEVFRASLDHLRYGHGPTTPSGDARQAPFIFFRHLLMPGHLECCTLPVLDHLAAILPETPVNLMTGYHPYRMGTTKTPMARMMPPPETAAAIARLRSLPFLHPLLDGVPLDG